MRTVVIALATIAVLAMPAYAQGRGKGGKRSESPQQTDEQKRKNAESEAAYKDAVRKIPDQKAADPWSNMRK